MIHAIRAECCSEQLFQHFESVFGSSGKSSVLGIELMMMMIIIIINGLYLHVLFYAGDY